MLSSYRKRYNKAISNSMPIQEYPLIEEFPLESDAQKVGNTLSLGQQFMQGLQRGKQLVAPIAAIPGQVAGKANELLTKALGLPPVTQEGVMGLLKDAFTAIGHGEQPGSGETRTPEQIAVSERMRSRFPGMSDEVYGPAVTGVVMPGIGPTIVPVNTQMFGLQPPPSNTGNPAGEIVARGVQETATPANALLMASGAGLGPQVIKALGIAFGIPSIAQGVEEAQQGDVPGAVLHTVGGGLMAAGGLVPERAAVPSGITPSEIRQGGPEMPFLMRNRPGIPMEDRPQFQETPPLIGQRPVIQEFPILPPVEVRPPTGLVTPELPSAVKAEPLAGQISFEGQGVPSAMQARVIPGLSPDETRVVEQVMAEPPIEVTGPSATYRPPSPPLTQEQFLAKQQRQAVEEGLTMPQPPSYEVPQPTAVGQTLPTQGVVMSNLQKARLRKAVERGASPEVIRNILREGTGSTLLNVTEPSTILKPPTRFGSGIPLDDFEQYQDLVGKMKVALANKDFDAFYKLQQQTEAIKNRQGQKGMPPTAPSPAPTYTPGSQGGKVGSGINPEDLRPAVRIAGRLLVGERGDTHADILERYGYDPKLYPHSSPNRGFALNGEFLDRKQAEQVSGLKGTAEAGGLDSQDLPEAAMHRLLRLIEQPRKETQNAVRELRTDELSRTPPSGNIRPVEEEVRSSAGAQGAASQQAERQVQGQEGVQEGTSAPQRDELLGPGTTFSSGFPLKLEREREGKGINAYWMHFAGNLIPETQDYQTAREVVEGAPKGTPAERPVSEENAKSLEQEMARRGFTKVIKQGDTYFVDQNASRQQLAGIQNKAKSEGAKVVSGTKNLYSGFNPFDSKYFGKILDRFYGHGVERTPQEGLTHLEEKWSGHTSPAHIAANPEVANKMIKYAAADITRQVDPSLGQPYKDAALKDWIDEGINAGLYKFAQRGTPNTLANGEPTVGFEIRATGIGHKSLRVRADLAPEVEQVLKNKPRAAKAGMQLLLDLATQLQVLGPMDVTAHMSNMFSSIIKSPGKSSSYVVDQLLRQPGLKHIDSLVRVGFEVYKDIVNDPQVQTELKQISELGSLRGQVSYPTFLSEGAKQIAGAVAGPRAARIAENLTDTGKWIRVIDSAGRRARNKMFDNLVKQGVEDTPENRREFINKMGQYNPKLMSEFQEWMQANLSQFVVAGRAFNRNAMESILASNEFKSAHPSGWAKAKVSNMIALSATAIVLPVIANYALTGKMFGRAGTPLGAIDTGKDDPQTGQPITIDPMKLDLSRRGLRISGLGDLAEGIRSGDSAENILFKASKSVILGQLHPWEGPPVRVGEAFKAAAGTKTPKEAFVEALKAINPSVSAYFSESESGERGGLSAVGKQLESTVGIGRGRFLSDVEKVEKAGNKPVGQMTLAERVRLEREVKQERGPMTEADAARAASRTIQSEAKRGEDLKAGFDKPIKQWIDSRHLIVPGYDNKLNFGKTKVYLTREESARLDTLVKEEALKTIQAIRNDKDFEEWDALPTQKKQELFHSTLTQAVSRAKTRLKEELSKANPSPSDAQIPGNTQKKRKRYKVLGE